MIEIFVLIFLLLLSASFSSFETALFSLSRVQRSRMEKAGRPSSLIVHSVKKPRELLMTVLLGNELVNVAIAILAGSLAYAWFAGYQNSQSIYLASTAITTLLVLIFGEIVPKNIAIRYPAFVAQLFIIPYQIFAAVVFPLRWTLTLMADGMVRCLGMTPQIKPRMMVEEELRNLLAQGHEEGTLADLERKLFQNALDFADLKVSQVMTPREDISALPVESRLIDVVMQMELRHFSRFPVYEGSLDHLVGVLHVKELLAWRSQQPMETPSDLRPLLKDFVETNPNESLESLLKEFQKRRIHMAIVKDKDVVVGLITMDDLLRCFFEPL